MSEWPSPTNWTEVSSSALPEYDDADDTQLQRVAVLVWLYGVVLTVGVVGNVGIVAAIMSQPGGRSRSLLLLQLCASDLLVCGVTVPVSAAAVASSSWTLGAVACKTAFFFQTMPVAASTLSLMMLSLDRYAAVKHPRVLARMGRQSGLPAAMALFVWLGAAAVSVPVIVVRVVSEAGQCEEAWTSPSLRTAYALTHIGLVYLVPCLTVAGCHWAVGHKLCAAASASVPAAAGLPLPAPRKPRQVIIVADGQSKVVPLHGAAEGDSDDDDAHEQIRADLAERQRRPRKPRHGPRGPRVRRASRSERAIVRANRRLRRPPLVKQASRQSLQSRRRLAKLLVALGGVFATCWLPYVVVRVYAELAVDGDSVRELLPFVLLLGHTHSAINPVVYWLLNRQTLRWPAISARCTSCPCFTGELPLRWPSFPGRRDARLDWNPRASSTNEAALGAFHPKYNKARPQQNELYRPRASSVFLN
ncbi:Alpha-2 adrenergic receptor [Frankliniella fusca]|uniref:Alpha-2 adrenergic receptor n=1 Tax=Frankliniella fusca TaxID=407009 RepID=A0AAE1LSB4_9NEOP|nr:Alpha-2 adrenergic receptor [Frankliniella fusca]